MAQLNAATQTKVRTHEGAPAVPAPNALAQLRRSVLSCLLWEDEFYEDGQVIAKRLYDAARAVAVEDLAALTVEARSVHNLRHAPLLLLSVLIERARGQSLVADTIAATIQRADELSELVALYWKNGKRPLSAQLKKGLARAFTKFDAYQIAKYDRAKSVRLRDVLFLCHATPKDEEQAAMWKALVDGTLTSPDTWEVELSAGKDKRETFERLMREGRLGYLAVLRNLRNMVQAKVDDTLIRETLLARKGAQRVLPFRYVAAARAVPQLEPVLDEALSMALDGMAPLPGRTIILVDVSGSMDTPLSGKSDLNRIDAAATLASVIPGQVRVFTFSSALVEVPPRRGMAGVDAVLRSQPHGGTLLGAAIAAVGQFPHDRLIVVTDEQSQDTVGRPTAERAYMINVASYQNGVGYGKPWVHISGFSENVLRFIAAHEADRTPQAVD